MTEVVVVGICGKARSGKDTFARFLEHKLKKEYEILATSRSMATPLKGMLNVLYDYILTDENQHLMLPENKEQHFAIGDVDTSPRHLMQTLGTDWGREMISPDIWIECMYNQIETVRFIGESMGESEVVVIIPDIRYDNEVCLCDYMVQIERPDAEAVLSHKSENGIMPALIDCIITNDGSLDQLKESASQVAGEVLDVCF